MSETDHVGFISLVQLVSEIREWPNFKKQRPWWNHVWPSSRNPYKNTIEGNIPHKYSKAEVPVEQRRDSAKINERDSSSSSSNNACYRSFRYTKIPAKIRKLSSKEGFGPNSTLLKQEKATLIAMGKSNPSKINCC